MTFIKDTSCYKKALLVFAIVLAVSLEGRGGAVGLDAIQKDDSVTVVILLPRRSGPCYRWSLSLDHYVVDSGSLYARDTLLCRAYKAKKMSFVTLSITDSLGHTYRAFFRRVFVGRDAGNPSQKQLWNLILGTVLGIVASIVVGLISELRDGIRRRRILKYRVQDYKRNIIRAAERGDRDSLALADFMDNPSKYYWSVDLLKSRKLEKINNLENIIESYKRNEIEYEEFVRSIRMVDL